ncbi:hypothetical protein J7E97_05355 [Streptomyces sp. ISL-66]|uniref:hypothetical protein n=1 Tax=Streptomyces sp. ISL-66 TaxID=2819186 RepID=UPI001BE66B86|nr:hypothetical protein [Streptomyces sp. ISL-66]MBT2467309.1 hypothetical protein [Streptomyces sp. ISL-66]
MADAVPVRCPACLHENDYTAPVFPCACGSPVIPPLDLAAPPRELIHRTWSDSWVTVRCAACGREGDWPHPEVGCGSCGTVLVVPVHPLEPAGGGAGADADGLAAGFAGGFGAVPDLATPDRAAPDRATPDPTIPDSAVPGRDPTPADAHARRPAFRPVTIRTARDAVSTAALYLRWLGFPDVRQPDGRPNPSAAVDLRAPGLVAQVDPTTAPAGLRAVECVWLNGLTASATSVYFALAGYTPDARARADDLGIPLFVMDLTGMPQPVNDPADELVGTGA